MLIKKIKFGTSAYNKLVSLRDEILRKPLGLKFSKEDLAKEYNQEHFAYFKENEIIAGLILVPSNDKLIKMRQVCVTNNMQGKGIGKELVLFVEAWAKENGYKQIYCHARKNALEFYSKLDYKIEGKTFLEVGLEHFNLEKKI